MQKRPEIKNCKGENAVVMNDGFNWFRPADDAIPDFVACEACYEDVILATRFGQHFVPDRLGPGANDKWTCDIAGQYFWRLLLRRSRLNDWDGFVKGSNAKMKMPACKGEMKLVTAL